MLYLENLKESDQIGDLKEDGRLILKSKRWEVNIKIECQGVNLIYLVHCRALLSKVINLPVLQNVGSFLDQLGNFKFLKRIL
jgi:hypothetical protein